MKKIHQIIILVAVLAISLLLLKACNSTSEPEEEEGTTVTENKDSGKVAEQVKSEEKTVTEPETTNESEPVSEIKKTPQKSGYYQSPLDGALSLSGSFGELRNNHFHAGMDLRTGGVEGKNVYAAADGYVSRIKVSTGGYGKALYIQHPNGTTTVYGHLQKYAGDIQSTVIAKQYAQEKYEVEIFPSAGQLRVKKGQVVAISGNTGGSGGPHLHFEIRDKNGNTTNPLLHGIDASDAIKPRILGGRLYQIDNEHYQNFGIYASVQTKNNGTITVPPGTYGMGLNWVDYFTDQLNRLGVNYATVKADGKIIFTHKIEKFAFSEGRYINKHIDFWRYSEKGVRYVKLFKDPGNPLRFYKGNGLITVKDNETVTVELEASDYVGQSTIYTVVLIGSASTNLAMENGSKMTSGKLCSPNSSAVLKSDHASVEIPQGALYNKTYIDLSETEGTGKAISPMVRLSHANVPLHKAAVIRIDIPSDFEGDKNKIVMMEYNKKTRSSSYFGGKRVGNRIEEYSKTLGVYYLAVDTIPPKVTTALIGRNLRFSAVDYSSDIVSYRCLVDNEWVLLEYEPKLNRLFGVLPDKYGSGKHSLTLVVRDAAGNETEIKKDFNI